MMMDIINGFGSKSRSSQMVLCEFCNIKVAVLYCGADTAKICLFCDQQVHSANALSLKHLRSRICEYCRADPVSVCCCDENLMLCQECDWELHRYSSTSRFHKRDPVEQFSGCPSAIELASLFGVDLKDKNLLDMSSASGASERENLNLQEIMVPKQSCSIFMSKEMYKQEVCEQLVEMGKRDFVRLDGDRIELGPGKPPSRCGQVGNMGGLEVENAEDDELLEQQTPFSSLLMSPPYVHLRDYDCSGGDQGGLIWDSDPAHQPAQNQSNQLISSYAPTTEEINIARVTGPSLESRPVESEIWDNTRLVQATHHSVPDVNETTIAAKPEVVIKLLAQNRGNAMLRYKEKKKYRRYDKQIRYESRKARADTRKRVKGRFVKASHDNSDVEI